MMRQARTAASAAAVLVCFVAAGAVGAQFPAAQADVQRGKQLYGQYCARCHGAAGRGDGADAKKLGFFPRDFTLGAYKCRCTPTGELPTDADLFRTVTRGLPGTPMQAHDKEMSEADRWAVVSYIKTLSPAFTKGNRANCAAAPNAPAGSAETVADGKALYRLMQCDKCHGRTGRGDGPAAASLKDDWGRPIKAYNFVAIRNFKCGNDDADLFRTLQTGLTGSPMPSYASALVFSRDLFTPAVLQAYGPPADVKELTDYVARQPDQAALGTMSAADRQSLSERRTWALVQYLRSLFR